MFRERVWYYNSNYFICYIIQMLAADANKKHQLSTTKYCTHSGLLTYSVCLHLQENLTTWMLPDFSRPLCAWSNYAIKLIM